jgi:uncharacterized protein (TIGR03083 family)
VANTDAPQAEHIRFHFDPAETLAALARQRRRFAGAVAGLSDGELAAPSRCAGWSVADVVRHLVWVDVTMRRLWSGEDAVAKGFDPRRTPDEAVRTDRAVPDEEVRQRYLTSTAAMAEELEGAGPQRFGETSRSPAGRVPWWMSVVHVGWDSCIHERDVLLPLGRAVEPPPEENELCLAYSLVMASFFADRDEPLAVRLGGLELVRADGLVVVRPLTDTTRDDEAAGPGTLTLSDPVQVIDAMAGRGSLEDAVTGDPLTVRRIGGLARFFTSTP